MQKKEETFLAAAKANDTVKLSKIFLKRDKGRSKGNVKEIIDINVKNSDGTSAIHYAARHGNIKMIDELLSRGAIIDAADKIGWRPLSYATAHNKSESVSRLLNKGSKVNLINETNSPIHIASAFGHKDIVKILMDRGADIHCQNQRNQTPVDVACENNHYGVVNILLSGSSNQIEEFSKNSFKTSTRKYIHPSIVKTATLPTAMSNNNIASISSNTTPTGLNNSLNLSFFNKRDTGSQEYISTPNCYITQTFKSNSTKKSESLNTIFMQADESKKCNTQINDSSFKNDLEIILPYPSKFSTSEVLKLKSPILPLKKNLFHNQIALNKDINDMPTLKMNSTDRKYKSFDEAYNVKEESLQCKKVDDNVMNKMYTQKTSKSSLTIQTPYTNRQNYIPQHTSQDVTYFKPSLNGKPPISKEKMRYKSDSDKNSKKASELCKNKSYQHSVKEKPLINSFNMRSSSQTEFIKYPRGGALINSSYLDNDGISCYKWIQSIDLLTIWDTLVNEGFDSFLALSLANDEELLRLCNSRIDHLDTLKNELSSLNILSMDQLIFSLDIQQTLILLGLEEYSSNFIQEGYFYINHLPNVSDKLMNQLGIIKTGHRRILMECFIVQVQNRLNSEVKRRCNNILSNLPSQTLSYPSMLHFHYFSTRRKINKCNSLPRCNMYNSTAIKKIPPPIPPRSCSIPNHNSFNPKTLDDILIESKCLESSKKKNCYASNDLASDLANLDEIMTMLENLSKEIN